MRGRILDYRATNDFSDERFYESIEGATLVLIGVGPLSEEHPESLVF
jgi:hypothetical protein